MNTRSSSNIPVLDGWRGLAISLVLMCHFLEGALSTLGMLGVLLFFALSGLLMGQLLFIKQVELSTFFVRRFSRVMPTLWLFALAMFIYGSLFQSTRYTAPLGEVVSTLLFLRTYFPADLSIWAEKIPTGHFWSLNVEEHCYVYLAIGAFLFGRAKHRLVLPAFLVASTAAVYCISLYYNSHPPSGASPWFIRSECASLGLLGSAAYRVARERSRIRLPRQVTSWLSILSILAAVACFTSSAPPVVLIGSLFLACAVNHLDAAPAFFKWVLSLRVLRWFGTCSFSVYLWQQPFYKQASIPGANRLLWFSLALATGVASFYLIENPVRLYVNRLWEQRQLRRSLKAVNEIASASIGEALSLQPSKVRAYASE